MQGNVFFGKRSYEECAALNLHDIISLLSAKLPKSVAGVSAIPKFERLPQCLFPKSFLVAALVVGGFIRGKIASVQP